MHVLMVKAQGLGSCGISEKEEAEVGGKKQIIVWRRG